MRKDRGWYPSGLADRNVPPRESPADWNAKPGETFDFFEAVGTVSIVAGKDGWFTDGPIPTGWETCWHPGDPEAREFRSLDDLAAAMLDDQPLGVEFIRWERDVSFRIGEDGMTRAE